MESILWSPSTPLNSAVTDPEVREESLKLPIYRQPLTSIPGKALAQEFQANIFGLNMYGILLSLFLISNHKTISLEPHQLTLLGLLQ